MRRLFVASSILILIAMSTKSPFWSLLIGILALYKSIQPRHRLVFLLFGSLILFRLLVVVPNNSFTEGTIIEINPSSVLVAKGFDRILVLTDDVSDFHAMDRVVITGEVNQIQNRVGDFGFDARSWAQANRIIGSVSESQVQVFCRKTFLHELLAGGVAQKHSAFTTLWRDLLYDTNKTLGIFDVVSMGIQFSVFLYVMDLVLIFVASEKLARYLRFLGLLLFSWLLGFPLAAWRILVDLFLRFWINDRTLKFSLSIFIFYLVCPQTLSQWPILIPLLFQASNLFFPHKIRRFVSWVFLAFVFSRSEAIVSPLDILLFPFLRSLMKPLVLLFWLSLFIPYLSYVCVGLYQFFTTLYITLPTQSFQWIGMLPDWILLCGLILFLFLPSRRRLHKIILVCFVMSPFRYYLLPIPQVVYLNAGQGDAMLVRSALNRCTVLMDTGPPIQAKTLISTLRSKSVNHVDALVLTHDDADHAGNKQVYSASFTIDNIVTDLQNISCPGLHLMNLTSNTTYGETNADSLVYATSLLGTRFLFMADTDVKVEQDLINKYELQTDIVKLGHHGSQTSTSESFVGSIQAKLAIISVGENNYGHPHASVLQRLRDYRLPYRMTRQDGDITVSLFPGFALVTSSQGRWFLVKTQR